jgi:hypothetical protein
MMLGDAGNSSGALSGDIRYVINQASGDPGSTITFDTGPGLTSRGFRPACSASFCSRYFWFSATHGEVRL